MDRIVVGRVLMALGALLVVVGLAGFVFGGGDEADTAVTVAPSSSTSTTTTSTSTTTTSTSTTTTSTTTTSTTMVPPAETPEEFLAVLLDAFAGGDEATLFARMNQATLDRYGVAQCEIYAATIAGMAQELTFRGSSAAPTWDYVTDDMSTSITAATVVEVARLLNGETFVQELHWQLVDGRYTWFTDCGEPI